MDERGLDDLSWLDDLTEAHIEAMTADDRIGLMWPMTVAEWRKRGVDVTKQPLDRSYGVLWKRLPGGSLQLIKRLYPE